MAHIDKDHPPKMAPRSEAPAGLETDGEGNVIPLAQRTEDDRRAALEADVKDPEGESQTPAPMPNRQG